MAQKKEVEIFQDTGSLFIRASELIISIAKEAIEKRNKFVIALSGGHTPEQLFTLLSKEPYRNSIDWNRAYIFWGDERCVPLDDAQNNAHMARLILLSKLDIPLSNIYPVPVNLSPADAAREYENEIGHFFANDPPVFDLILLGLGTNGHTASLFPYSAVLNEQQRLVKEVYVEELQMFRVTMTSLLINQAHHIVFLVTGKEKAAILNAVLNTTGEPDKYPVLLIKPLVGKLYWLVDRMAASLL